MATVSLGKIAFSWKSSYSASSTYNENDVVNHNGTSYICKTDSTTNVVPTTAATWDVFAQGANDITSTAGEIIYHDGTNLTALAVGEAGQTLTIDNSGNPSWATPTVRSGLKTLKLQDSNQPVMYRRGCCIQTDGSIRFWGRGENWMHGTGNQTYDRSYPVQTAFPPGTADMTYVCGNYDYSTVSIDSDGKFWAWGQNDQGDIGRGNTTNTLVPYCASDNTSNTINGKTVIQYAPCKSADNYLSHMVLTSDGKVHCSGYNGYGQLGRGDTTQRTNFGEVIVISDIIQIARGSERYTSCYALKEVTNGNNQVYAWGHNGEGRLGNGNTSQQNVPTQLTAMNGVNIVKIGCGSRSGWALDDTGDLWTWGYNGYGNLGRNGTSTNTTSYTPAVALSGVSDVYMGGNHRSYDYTMAIKTDKTLWATGDNTYGCLGTANNTTDRSTFAQCKKDASNYITGITKVVCGGYGSYNFTIALDEDGVAWSTGYSGNGQLGRGTNAGTNYYFQPVLIHRRTVVDIAVVGADSQGGSMYLLDDGQLFMCGYAGESQLPEDDDEYMTVPMPVIF